MGCSTHSIRATLERSASHPLWRQVSGGVERGEGEVVLRWGHRPLTSQPRPPPQYIVTSMVQCSPYRTSFFWNGVPVAIRPTHCRKMTFVGNSHESMAHSRSQWSGNVTLSFPSRRRGPQSNTALTQSVNVPMHSLGWGGGASDR